MEYPFDPTTLVPPGTVTQPEPDAYQQAIQLRAMQLEVIAETPNTYLGAPTYQIPFEEYAVDTVIGSQFLNTPALRDVAVVLAQSFKTILGTWPLPSQLKPDPDAYWLIGQLWPDPVNTDEPVNHATMAFMTQFFQKIGAYGYKFVESVAYEILNFFMPENWKQRNYLGNPALSGWSPPSCFLRPTSDDALQYIARVQIQVIRAALNAGVDTKFQIGEPWWWDGSYSSSPLDKFAPCLYDEYTRAQYELETGKPVPTPWITNIFEPLSPENEEYAYWLRAKLGQSTNLIRDLVWQEFNSGGYGFNYGKGYGVRVHIDATLLFFTPQIMSPQSELTNIMNFPVEYWENPNYDFVQIEDYDWIIAGRLDLVPLTFDAATVALGYPREVVHYFVGFILNAWDYHIWPWIDKAIRMAKDANMPFIYVWSYTQAMRDSIVYNDELPQALEIPIFFLPPNWSSTYQISREFRTEIQSSRGLIETRRAERSVARKTLTFTALMGGRDKRKFDAFLATWQGFRFYMPELTRSVEFVGELAGDQIGVQLERIPAWIQLGTVVLLVDGDNNIGARVVDRLVPEDNVIEFTAPDAEGKTWPAGTVVYPALFGQLADGISTRRLNGAVSENMITFNVVPGSEMATRNLPAAPVVFDGVEVWEREPNWTSQPSIQVATGVEIMDEGVGTITPYQFAPFTQRMTKYTYMANGVTDMELVQNFFERMMGQQGVVFVPTWEQDLILTDDNVAGDYLVVEGDEVFDYLQNDGVLRNVSILDNEGGLHHFKIVNVTPDGDNSRIQVTPPVTAELLARVDMVMWLVLSRLGGDAYTEGWVNEKVCNFELTFKSLLASEK